MYIYIYIFAPIYIYIYIFTPTYIYIYIHTHYLHIKDYSIKETNHHTACFQRAYA